MATTNPNVDAITGYVEQHNLPLLSKSIIGSTTTKYFNLMTGVKGTAALNILDADPALQCGNACGFDPATDTTFTQREIKAIPFKVNMTFCDKNLLDTWANYEVKVAAGLKNLPFEEEWTNQIVDKVKVQVEDFIWNGGEYCSANVKGILGILREEGGEGITVAEGTTTYNALVSAYLDLDPLIQSKDDVVIFTSFKRYNELVQEILSASHYHLDVTNYEEGVVLPGTRVKVIPISVIPETYFGGATYQELYGVIGRLSNFYYATDLRGDEEKFDLWYSKDNREFRLAIEFTAGAQVAFPNEAGLILGQ